MNRKIDYDKPVSDEVFKFIEESNAIEDVFDSDSFAQSVRAWNFLMAQDALSIDVVLKTHKILMLHSKLRPNEKGYFRRENMVVGRWEVIGINPDTDEIIRQWKKTGEGMDWHEVSGRIWSWSLETMRHYPPVDWKALHILYEKIHPFIDGNGRTGRMFMNWTRIKRLNLPVLIIEKEKRHDYYEWFK